MRKSCLFHHHEELHVPVFVKFQANQICPNYKSKFSHMRNKQPATNPSPFCSKIQTNIFRKFRPMYVTHLKFTNMLQAIRAYMYQPIEGALGY